MLLYLFLFFNFHKSAVTIKSRRSVSVLSRLSARSPPWRQQRTLGLGDAGPGNTAADYEAREVNFRLHKYSMRMEMGLLRVPDESGCKGLSQWRRKCLAVRYRHMSLFGAVTSAYRPADKIQQIAEVCVCACVRVALSLPCTPLLLLMLHVIEFCARRAQLFIFFPTASSSALQNKLDSSGRPTGHLAIPARCTVGAKGSELPSVAEGLGVIFKQKRW